MKTAAMDFGASILAQQLRDGLREIATALGADEYADE
jgi:hypothetical protein